ncbi:MAG TPA: aryl-sulfate sulfotransferase [Terriglobia bacterium]|nr:aryl-sulfate sulfotransferase [Terriglobia bacterium]
MKSRVLVILILLVVVVSVVFGQGTAGMRGLRLKCDGVSPGYLLFAPMSSEMTYLTDLDGNVIRTWRSSFLPSAWVYFLDNGHVLRGGNDKGGSPFGGGGQGGRFQEFDFDGDLVWDFTYNDPRLPHHDAAVLPNGNILAIAWEGKSAEEARRAGRRSSAIPSNGIWPDMLIEFEPVRPNSARIVWEWHIWDHLIQNIDPILDNYGDPAAHPERVNINGETGGGFGFSRDLFHTNAVAYNPQLDQIILSVPTFNEVWVIDHSTTTQEAAGRTGGRSGNGGDLLYRWGNPRSYGRGPEADQLLGFQHDARWIPAGYPGAGNIMVFSNQTPNANDTITKVYEFVPPVDASGHYAIPALGPFGPTTPLWTYTNPSLQPINLSGAERLPGGNTLISSGPQGRVFEIKPTGEIVWEYWSPYSGPLGNSGSSFSLFRATKIRPDHPGLGGRDLRPLDPQPPISPSASSGTLPPVGPCPAPSAPKPTLTSITPDIGARGAATSLEVTLTGTNFVPGLIVNAGPDVSVTDIQVTSSSAATAKLNIAADAPLGALQVSVATPGGTTDVVPFAIAEPFPDLLIRSTHAKDFGAGFEETYTVTVTNAGTAPATGTIAVTEILPAEFAFVSATGPGWVCSAAASTLGCTHSGGLAPADSVAYEVTVAVNASESTKVTRAVSVTVDGDLYNANNTAADPSMVLVPSPRFVFAPAALIPGQQTMLSVVMATPFPHDVTGSVALTFSSNAVIPLDDPAIQLATGGRTVTFTIPANETEAHFGDARHRGPLAFQSGTVAGTLVFTGTFTAGWFTRDFAASGLEALSIPRKTLSIQNLETSRDGGFAASILLLSAAREVTHLSLSFTTNPRVALSCGGAAGCSVAGNTLTLEVAPLFSQWFSGDTSFGGLAKLRIPIRIEGGAVRGTVAVTLRNTMGESNSQSFALP